MTRSEYTQYCRNLLNEQGLSDWSVRLTTDLNKPFLGLTSYKDKCIILNAHHCDIHPDIEVIDTLKHEVAHALCIGEGHNEVWQQQARALGCLHTEACSHLSFSPDIIDAIRSDANVEVETIEEVIYKPKYTISRLQDKCEFCGKVAKEKSSNLITNSDPIKPDEKYIWLECGHLIVKKIPKGTPFQTIVSDDGKSPYPFQVEGARFIESALSINRGAAVFDEMGLGKVQSVDTPILTINGWKRNGDLVIGDLVISSDGQPHPVTGIYPQGEIDLYKIHFSDGSSTNCGDEHLWIVNTPIRKWRNQSNFVKSFKELKEDLQLTSFNSAGIKNNKWFIPITESVNLSPREVLIEPYLLGLLLGDGSFSSHVRFTNIDKELIDCVGWKQISDNDYQCNSVDTKAWLRHYNLIGTKSNNKFIPEDYKFNSIQVRQAILQGLMDTDGSIWNNGVVEYTTVSPYLANGVLFLIESLGGTARLTTKKEPKYQYKGETLIGQLAYRIVINIPTNPFCLKRKADKWIEIQNKKKYNPTRAIVGYEYIGKKEGQCIAVDSPDHSYLTENCIVTHNTIQVLAYLKFHPEVFPVLFIVKSGIKFQWFKEILRWLDDSHLAQVISSSSDFIIPNLKCYIASYDIFVHKSRTRNGKTITQGFDITRFEGLIKTIVLDECQQIKNPDSSRTREIRKLAKSCKVIALSGTPWKNRGSEFFTILNMLAPMKFPSYQRFLNEWVDTYFDGSYTKQGGIRRPDKFKEYIKDIAIRREVTDVMKELPEVNRTLQYTELERFEQKEYDREVSEFVAFYNDKVIGGEENDWDTQGNILARLARMRHITGLAKIPATEEFIDEFIAETDRKLVIFVHHKDVGDILYNNLLKKFPNIRVLKLTAEQDSLERFKIQEEFQNSERAILVASTLASGEGINLQTCADAIMHERQWNPQNEDQAAPGRFRRIGSIFKTVNVIFMTAAGTVDETLAGIVERKRVQFHNAMNNGELPTWNQAGIVKELIEGIVEGWNKRNRK